jgi:hypothetical protein
MVVFFCDLKGSWSKSIVQSNQTVDRCSWWSDDIDAFNDSGWLIALGESQGDLAVNALS